MTTATWYPGRTLDCGTDQDLWKQIRPMARLGMSVHAGIRGHGPGFPPGQKHEALVFRVDQSPDRVYVVCSCKATWNFDPALGPEL